MNVYIYMYVIGYITSLRQVSILCGIKKISLTHGTLHYVGILGSWTYRLNYSGFKIQAKSMEMIIKTYDLKLAEHLGKRKGNMSKEKN